MGLAVHLLMIANTGFGGDQDRSGRSTRLPFDQCGPNTMLAQIRQRELSLLISANGAPYLNTMARTAEEGEYIGNLAPAALMKRTETKLGGCHSRERQRDGPQIPPGSFERLVRMKNESVVNR